MKVTPIPKPKTVRLKGKAMEQLRWQVYRRANGFCETCGKWVGFADGHLSHIKSRGAGGGDTLENTRWKCVECHSGLEHTKGVKNGKRE